MSIINSGSEMVKVDSQRQIFEELLMAILVTFTVFSREMLKRRRRKIYFV